MRRLPPTQEFLIRTRKGETCFAFLDPELGLIFPDGTHPRTQALFKGWYRAQKDRDAIPVGVRFPQLAGSYYLRIK